MNVFVLTTGRSGSTTFYEACKHIKNYTCSHESRVTLNGSERLNYPENHIEIDNRLSWFLGALDEKYGDNAIYVHLKRDNKATAKSYYKRRNMDVSIMRGFYLNIMMKHDCTFEDAIDLTNTMHSNISLFLKDKSNVYEMQLENFESEFSVFLTGINADFNDVKISNVLASKYNEKINLNWKQKLYAMHISFGLFVKSIIYIFKLNK